ncbi:MarR family winged helix-turn-helix transcriptional regulator [Actinomadura syzygii]|uniref:MarR family transcriptional regulator n=1 Tax=Actinomadura syzygii TaxID=1427538 RepID=A0A5D0U5W7_9ACTN|nr:MarR family transcriptional regulator [Actinomadura syzygii]TYC13135.1 MarR family transcriptional regulator [Actinomadura syzygii]
MAAPPGPVAAATGAERAMFDFVDAYDRAFERAAQEHGLSMAQACVLGRVGRDRGMRELADELGCDASNITQIIRRLEARGLVRRRPHPEDGRSRQIVRTPEGTTLYAAFEESFAFARAVTAGLSADERDQLTVLLRKALDAASRPTP